MTADEIFTQLCAHMIEGLMIHDQMASSYGFLNLCGYQKCHEYHYYHESYNYRCLYDYYLSHYHKLVKEAAIENPNIIPPNWYKYTRPDVDANTKRAAVKDLIKKWVDWEKDTKAKLEHAYKELYDLGDISAALKIAYFLNDASKELEYAESKMIDMENIGYDLGAIVNEQKYLYDKYKHKMNCIYEDDN